MNLRPRALFLCLVLVGVWLSAAACAYRRPHVRPAVGPDNAPAATVHLAGAIHTLRVEPVYALRDPAVVASGRLVIEPPPAAAGGWRLAWRWEDAPAGDEQPLASEGDTSRQLRRPAAVATWSLPATAVNTPRAVVVRFTIDDVVAASTVDVRLTKRPTSAADIAHLLEPVAVARPRSPWLASTYPVWGLTRDLLDAPITALNQAGFLLRPTLASILGESPRRNTTGVVFVAVAIAVTVVVFYAAIAPWYFSTGINTASLGALHYPILAVRWVLALPVVMAIGAAIGLGLLGLNEFALGPAQTLLLRSGTGASFARDVSPIDLADGWDAEAVARYGRWRRAFDYFPNRRYGAHRIEFQSPPMPAPAWTIDTIQPPPPPAGLPFLTPTTTQPTPESAS